MSFIKAQFSFEVGFTCSSCQRNQSHWEKVRWLYMRVGCLLPSYCTVCRMFVLHWREERRLGFCSPGQRFHVSRSEQERPFKVKRNALQRPKQKALLSQMIGCRLFFSAGSRTAEKNRQLNVSGYGFMQTEYFQFCVLVCVCV